MKFLFKDSQYSPIEACVCALLAFFIFSSADIIAKWLLSGGLSTYFVLSVSYAIGLLQILVIMWWKDEYRATLNTPHRKWHILRGIVILLMTFCLLHALAVTPLASFYSIMFTVPFLVTIGSVIFFGDKVGVKDWVAIAVGFTGILIILRPDQSMQIHIGYLYAIGAALGVASSSLLARKIGSKEKAYPFAFYVFIIILLGNVGLTDWSQIYDVTLAQATVLCLYGAILPLGIILLSSTYAKAPSVAYVAPFQYTQMVWGLLFGFFIFNEIPRAHVFIGAAIVIGCGLYVLLHARHVNRKSAKIGQPL